tara:strand:+ start:293 stop:628 length:336 start_codon:yes stop_codon:yes gene_type:complete
MSKKPSDIEKYTLLPDRYYIILTKVNEEEFTLTAYDTTGKYNEESPCSASVAQEGILELFDTEFSKILSAGVARMEYRKILDKDESFSKELKDHAINKLDNVVKIDFGKKQ